MLSVRTEWVIYLAHSSCLVSFESYFLTTFSNVVYILGRDSTVSSHTY